MSEREAHKVMRCREESCKAAIVFLKSKKTGKPVPVDAETIGDETEQEFDPAAGHVSHFGTCTAPKKFSRHPKKESR